MLPIAGQTAGPNGLTFLWTLRGGQEVSLAKKKIEIFFFKKFFHGPRRVLQLVLNNSEISRITSKFSF